VGGNPSQRHTLRFSPNIRGRTTVWAMTLLRHRRPARAGRERLAPPRADAI
jgi:hypothetical protein